MRPRACLTYFLPLCAILLCLASGSSFASSRFSGSIPAGALRADTSRLVSRGLYNARQDMPVLAPGDSIVNNRVMLTGSKVAGIITASYAERHRQSSGGPGLMGTELRQNRLILFGGHIEGAAHGAFGDNSASVIGNSLVMDDEYAYIAARDGLPFDAAATGGIGIEARQNSLLMHAGTVLGNLAGGYGRDAAFDNTLLLHGGTVSGSAFGGGTHSGKCFSNTVIMTGGSVQGQIVGGATSHYGTAGNNTVIFSGGKANGITGSQTFETPADNNTIIISGGAIAPAADEDEHSRQPAFIYGGQSFQGEAVNNKIFLGGRPRLENCVFYGGFSDLPTLGGSVETDVTSGNILTIEAHYQGELPVARNFEHVFLTSGDTRLPEEGYVFHPSVRRFNNHGVLAFSGLQPAGLHFAQTAYSAEGGAVRLYYHAKARDTDRITLDQGALLLSPLTVRLENINALPVDTPFALVEIEHASSMLHVNRLQAVRLECPQAPEASGKKGYDVYLKLLLGGPDKDVWFVEKREKPRQK